MDTSAATGALEALPGLLELFEHRVHIVSKAGPKIAGLTRRWMTLQQVTGTSGIDPANVHFVRARIDKAPICRDLNVTHFVDDRVDVLQHLATVRHRYLFTGGLGDHLAPLQVPRWAITVDTWPRLVGLLERDLGRN